MKNKKVLILGASSDIGISAVNYFLKNDWFVIAHYNKNKKNLQNIRNSKLECFKFDLKDIDKFKKFVNRNKQINTVDSFISLTGYINSNNVLNTDLSNKNFYKILFKYFLLNHNYRKVIIM